MRAQMLRKLYALGRHISKNVKTRSFRSTSQDQHLQTKRYHNTELERSTNSEQCNAIMQRWLCGRPQEEPWNGLKCREMDAKRRE